MNELFGVVISLPWPNWIVIPCIIVAPIFFIFQFLRPALHVNKQLGNAIQQLRQIISASKNSVITDLDLIGDQAMHSGNLPHLWSEYIETLHPQKTIDISGQEQVERWRATTMAETFFTIQVLVETPIKADFYKHMPGILTGLGIIGTFSGLIQGLSAFEISKDANVVRTGLRYLIHDVGHAFLVSAVAIALAMLMTLIEKIYISLCSQKVEELCQLIDSLFDAGAGEEYLARLVHASETSATQAMQLKDSLVIDLKQILSEITTQQVQAASQHSQKMSNDLSMAIENSMSKPMERISEAVSHVSSSQGDAVNKMLTDVLANFSAQMQDMFGGQLNGMADLLNQTNNAMSGTAAKFDKLADELQTAGQGTANAMAERFQESIAIMESRQGAMAEQMQNFMEQMRLLSKESQAEASQKMQSIMTELGDKVALMVGQLDNQNKKSAGEHESQLIKLSENMEDSLHNISTQMKTFLASVDNMLTRTQQQTADAGTEAIKKINKQHEIAEEASVSRQAELAEQSTKLISDLTNQIEVLGRSVADSAESTKASAAILASSSKSAIDRMNAGADNLLLATSELSDSEKRMAKTMGAVGLTTQTLQNSANILSGASSEVKTIFSDYKASTDTFSILISELNKIIETARHDASLTSDLVDELHGAAEKLNLAQRQAETYLDGVNNVLEEAHNSFAANVTNTMREGNSQFHEELSKAVGLLKGAIQDLGDTLDSVLQLKSID